MHWVEPRGLARAFNGQHCHREGQSRRRHWSLTKMKLHRLFDHADEQVAAARAGGRKGGLAAMRDSAALKVAYAWGCGAVSW